ncbi:hypothetical protein Pcinc_024785 [Petrolisthes cinctipes]|uniref:Uncharacterized protein n=1 Tax=Petrolisthes cinctipes TaxID=88211 RepID=A0AAE1FA40_PETCI|nr:hypothetical protein Pcinc_024785 [Petrolisthes cinctipes]
MPETRVQERQSTRATGVYKNKCQKHVYKKDNPEKQQVYKQMPETRVQERQSRTATSVYKQMPETRVQETQSRTTAGVYKQMPETRVQESQYNRHSKNIRLAQQGMGDRCMGEADNM